MRDKSIKDLIIKAKSELTGKEDTPALKELLNLDETKKTINKIATKLSRKPYKSMLPYNHLVYIGQEGFLRALERYNPEHESGATLFTYASKFIEGAIKEELNSLSWEFEITSIDEPVSASTGMKLKDKIPGESTFLGRSLDFGTAFQNMVKKQKQILGFLYQPGLAYTPYEIARETESSVVEVNSINKIFLKFLMPEKWNEIEECKILFIEDDEENYVKPLVKQFKRVFQAETITALNSSDAKKTLDSKDIMRTIDIIILDMMLPENTYNTQDAKQEEGEKILERIATIYPDIPLLVFSSILNIQSNPKAYSEAKISDLINKIQSKGALRAISKESLNYEVLFKTIAYLIRNKREKNRVHQAEFSGRKGKIIIENDNIFIISGLKDQKNRANVTRTQKEILKLLIENGENITYFEDFERIFEGKSMKIETNKKNLMTQLKSVRKIFEEIGIKVISSRGEGYNLQIC